MRRLVALLLLASMPATAAAPPFQTTAQIAFMKDLASGAILYDKGGDVRMPPASMAKMMTAYVAFEMIKQGKLRLDEAVTVRPETWQKWHGPSAGSTMFLSPGEQVSVENLLYGIVVLSGNDACVVLAEKIAGTEPAFAAQMNRVAKKIGLASSNFGNSNGWPDNGVTVVTARDLSTLAERTISDHPQLYKRFYSRKDFTWGQTMGSGQAITQANRDPLLGRVPGADGLKTGHTDEAGYGFTGSAIQNGRRLVMVLAKLGSFNERIDQSVQFMNWGFAAWQLKQLAPAGKQLQTAEVQLGDSREVGLVAPNDLAVTIPAGLDTDMKVRVVYQGPLKAPIKQGQHVADLIVSTPDAPPQTLPLVAATDVGEAGLFARIAAGFRWLFGMA